MATSDTPITLARTARFPSRIARMVAASDLKGLLILRTMSIADRIANSQIAAMTQGLARLRNDDLVYETVCCMSLWILKPITTINASDIAAMKINKAVFIDNFFTDMPC